VTDAAILLGVLEGVGPDPNDPATGLCPLPRNHDYTPHLKRDGLKGARVGIPRAFFYDKLSLPGDTTARGGLTPDQGRVMAEAIETLRREGAIIVDPADIPSVVDPTPRTTSSTGTSARARRGPRGAMAAARWCSNTA
jgi:amidase